MTTRTRTILRRADRMPPVIDVPAANRLEHTVTFSIEADGLVHALPSVIRPLGTAPRPMSRFTLCGLEWRNDGSRREVPGLCNAYGNEPCRTCSQLWTEGLP